MSEFGKLQELFDLLINSGRPQQKTLLRELLARVPAAAIEETLRIAEQTGLKQATRLSRWQTLSSPLLHAIFAFLPDQSLFGSVPPTCRRFWSEIVHEGALHTVDSEYVKLSMMRSRICTARVAEVSSNVLSTLVDCCKRLETLKLQGSGLLSLDGSLNALTGLKELHIGDRTRVIINPDFTALTSLRRMTLPHWLEVALPSTTSNLEWLTVSGGCVQPYTISNLHKLRYLSVFGALPGFLDALEKMPCIQNKSLQHLELPGFLLPYEWSSSWPELSKLPSIALELPLVAASSAVQLAKELSSVTELRVHKKNDYEDVICSITAALPRLRAVSIGSASNLTETNMRSLPLSLTELRLDSCVLGPSCWAGHLSRFAQLQSLTITKAKVKSDWDWLSLANRLISMPALRELTLQLGKEFDDRRSLLGPRYIAEDMRAFFARTKHNIYRVRIECT